MSESKLNSGAVFNSMLRRSIDQICTCIECSNEGNSDAEKKINSEGNKKIHECSKKLNTIVNRMILRTKINSVGLLKSIRRKLPSIKTNLEDTSNRNNIIYKPFNKFHKINKLNKLVVSTKRYKRAPKNSISYGFSDPCSNEPTSSNECENKIKPLPWETSNMQMTRNRKNRFLKSIKKEKSSVKSSSQHFFSLARIKSQTLITKSDLSNKLKKISSGNELKSYLLNCSSSLKVKTFNHNEEINFQNKNIGIDKTNENSFIQQQPKSLVNKEVIERVLRIKKTI